MTKTSPIRRKHFDCVPGTDGCDETFDIMSRATGSRVAWAAFWEERDRARRSARKLAAALEEYARGNVAFDISGLLAERRQIAVVWCVEDVQEVRPDLSEDQAWEVLRLAHRQHDATIGLNWECFQVAAQSLYGNAPEQGGDDE